MSSLLLVVLAFWLVSVVFFAVAVRRAPLIADDEELAAIEALRTAPPLTMGDLERMSLTNERISTHRFPTARQGNDMAVAV